MVKYKNQMEDIKEAKAKEYANSTFQSCKYPYTDDERVTDFDARCERDFLEIK